MYKNDRPIEDLEFSGRLRDLLKGAGIVTFGDLAGKTDADLLAIHKLGRRALYEVIEFMTQAGYEHKYGKFSVSEERKRLEEEQPAPVVATYVVVDSAGKIVVKPNATFLSTVEQDLRDKGYVKVGEIPADSWVMADTFARVFKSQ